MKKTKVLIPAIGLLVLSTAASITGTVAWFSVNNRVTVSGMTAHTRVSSNLLISADNNEANYAATMADQVVGAYLQPVSSVNGVSFFWTSHVSGNGAANSTVFTAYNEDTALVNAGAGKTNYDNEFNDNYGFAGTALDVCYGYIDYVFYLKATTTVANQKVAMKECNLLYNHDSLTANDYSWRVAVFSQAVAQGGSADPVAAGDLISILSRSGAECFNDDKAVAAANKDSVDYDNLSAVSNFNSAATFPTIVAAGTTQRYKVTVRLFLEGNDTHCTNETYALLTEQYSLDLAFELGSEAGLSNIESFGAFATASGATGTAKLRNGLEATAYLWKNADGDVAASGNNNQATYTATADCSFYCEITTASGTFKSNTVDLDVA